MTGLHKIVRAVCNPIDMASLLADRSRHLCSYSLKYPIRVTHPQGEWTIATIMLRWPPPEQVKTLMRIENDSDRTLEYLALMTGLPIMAIEEMDLEDIAALETVISRNLNNGANNG